MATLRALIAIAAAACALQPRAAHAQNVERPSVKPQPTHEFVWANAEAGFENVHLQTFSANTDAFTAGLFPTAASGPTFGFGAGLRIVFVTLGARARVALFNDDDPQRTVGNWQLWTLDAELGIRVPLGRAEPYFTVAGGYATFGGLSTALAGVSDGLNVHGIDARAAFGIDYYLTRRFSIGAQLGGDLLFVARDGVSVADLAAAKKIGTLNDAKARILEASGTSAGSAWALTGGIGLHF
jgi:hypothetical protein